MPIQAVALSCMPYGVTDAYLDAAKSREIYVVVRGTLTFDAGALPQVDWQRQDEVPPVTDVSARIEGVQLGQSGQRQALSEDILMRVNCFGPWCPSPEPGDALVFLRQGEAGYILETDPCGGFLFGRPDAGQMKAVQQCLDGGNCEASAFPEQ